VPSPHCIFKGIHKLPAGHSLIWKNGQARLQKYWDLSFPKTAEWRRANELAEELVTRLRDAVRLRLISDVPLGVFLSGGMDSTAVVAMMADLMPAAQVKTFCIGFEESSFDESSHARRVADFYGTNHHEEILNSRTLLDILPEVAGFLDEPFADASVIPTYLLARFTRRHVTVALGGDGGDELFAGYPTFPAHRLAELYGIIPSVLHQRLIQPLAQALPVSTDNFRFDFKLKQFLRGATLPSGIRHQTWLGSFSPPEQRELLDDAFGPHQLDDFSDILQAEKHCHTNDVLNRLIYLYCKFYLQDDILVKVDRATMARGLEARAPFLDYTFVEFANSIPSNLKLRGLSTKYILKQALGAKLPPDILSRPKKGFGIPIAKWFRTELRQLLLDTFSEERIRRQGLFNYNFISHLIKGHLDGSKDNRKQLWTLLMFQLWFDKYGRVAPGVPSQPAA